MFGRAGAASPYNWIIPISRSTLGVSSLLNCPLMRLYLSFLLFLTMPLANALPIENELPSFDVKQANRQFDQINLKLSIEDLNRADLDAAVSQLTELDSQAEYCITDTQKKLNNLSALAIPSQSISHFDKSSVDQVYINQQKKEIENVQAQCRLFSIRAKEAVEAYRSASSTFAKKEVLKRGSPLWSIVEKVFYQPLNAQVLQMTKVFFTPAIPSYGMGIGLVLFSIFASIFLFLKLQKSHSMQRLLRPRLLGFGTIFLLATTLLSGCFLIYQLSAFANDSRALLIPTLLFSYFFSISLVAFLFQTKWVRAYCLFISLDRAFVKSFLLNGMTLAVIGLAGYFTFMSVGGRDPLMQLLQSSYLFLSLSLFVSFVCFFCRKHAHFRFIQSHRWLIYNVTAFWMTMEFVLDGLGYHYLAMRLFLSVLTTLSLVSVTGLLAFGAHKVYLAFYTKPNLNLWAMRYVGYKKGQTFIELLIIKTILQGLTVATGIYFIGHSMDFTAYYVDSLMDKLIDGIPFVSMIIFPMHIIMGVITFCLLFIMFRCIATWIVRHHQSEGEEERQVALASIATYFGFSVALLAGLIIAGFNFTGLAIVAGALSVGIGLGLQSIVNNFVSGLLLLIEKPIQPGDRINVDGIEGFVKQIRIRSTHMITPNREDIIIPNSDLITRRVTNYMFSDKNCRISCEVNVTYGTDTNLVREVLLSIANLHEEVIKTGRSKPYVLFQSFGPKHLVFELSCLIKDVNRKGIVQSDLNYAIEENFRKHQIDLSA